MNLRQIIYIFFKLRPSNQQKVPLSCTITCSFEAGNKQLNLYRQFNSATSHLTLYIDININSKEFSITSISREINGGFATVKARKINRFTYIFLILIVQHIHKNSFFKQRVLFLVRAQKFRITRTKDRYKRSTEEVNDETTGFRDATERV